MRVDLYSPQRYARAATFLPRPPCDFGVIIIELSKIPLKRYISVSFNEIIRRKPKSEVLFNLEVMITKMRSPTSAATIRIERPPELVCRLDARGRLIYINPQSAWAIGRKPAELIGKTLRTALPKGTDRDHLVEAVQTVIRKSKTVELQLPCSTTRAQRQFKCCLLPEVNAAGKVAAVTLIITDISELQKRAVASEAAREAKNALVSRMSHDLRTPLAGILNMLDLIGEDPQKNCTKENMDLVLEAGRQLKSMFNRTFEALQEQIPTQQVLDENTYPEREKSRGSLFDALARLGPLRVLIVEDNYINLLAFRQTLEQSGFIVQEAINGKEALASLQRESFDLVLMDVRMPVMDGLEATRRIRASDDRRLRQTKIIALTGCTLPDDRRRIMSAGVDGIITKPIDTGDLARALKQIFPEHS
jgi:PAS domain S-box-containing protein